MSKLQDAFFTTVIVLMVGGTAAINHAQAAPLHAKAKKNQAGVRSYTVKGVRYQPLKTADNFLQTGKASWYGPGFHGKKTSNGERYNMHALTAAHKTLPLGTLVRVSNLANGKSVVVRINDRGPFHGKRVIDLSKAAASRLGFVHQGMANVRVESLNRQTVAENTPDSLPAGLAHTALSKAAANLTAHDTAPLPAPAAYLTFSKPPHPDAPRHDTEQQPQ